MKNYEIIYSEFSTQITNFFSELPKKILIALSGGVDSMALIYIAQEFCKNYNIELYSATINHNLRPESQEESQDIHSIMKESNIFHSVLEWEEGANIKSNIEAQAREARYSLLKEYAVKNEIEVIITAHHLDDQIENFLIRLTRGSGIDGLASMQAIISLEKNIKLFRPFLSLEKNILENYIAEKEIKYFEDKTNKNNKFLRNKVRNLLNNIENKELIDKRLTRTLNHLDRAKDFFAQHITKLYENIVKVEKNKLTISKKNFFALHPEEALRLLPLIFNKINHTKKQKPRFEKLKQLYKNIISEKTKKSSFAFTIIEIKQDLILFYPEY